MLYSMGVSLMGSPSTVTSLFSSLIMRPAALIDLGAVLLVQVSKLGVAAELGFDPATSSRG